MDFGGDYAECQRLRLVDVLHACSFQQPSVGLEMSSNSEFAETRHAVLVAGDCTSISW